MSIYTLGDAIYLTATVTEDGSPVDPDVLTFTIREPDDVRTSYVSGVDAEVEQVSTGVWRAVWLCRTAGSHKARWVATGNVSLAEEVSFSVARSGVLDPSEALS